MKYYDLPKTDLKVSEIALGCMRIADKSIEEVEELVKTALDCGINFFDHADIYGGGKSEELFGQVLEKHPEYREKMIIQTKCAIVPGKRYDFSKEYIMNAVNGSLERLHTDHVKFFYYIDLMHYVTLKKWQKHLMNCMLVVRSNTLEYLIIHQDRLPYYRSILNILLSLISYSFLLCIL